MATAVDLRRRMSGRASIRAIVAIAAVSVLAVIAACTTTPKGDEAPAKSAAPAKSSTAPSSTPATAPTSSQPRPQTPQTPQTSTTPGTGPTPTPPAEPAPQPPPTLQAQIADGIRLFESGEFYLAAGRLRNIPDINSAPVATQITALKYLAFSYCVTNRRVLCQQTFESALKLDPKFELAPAERGHPIWKDVYAKAKGTIEIPAAPKAAVEGKPPEKKPGTVTAKPPAKKSAAKPTGKAANAKSSDVPPADLKPQ